jgi:hypothetical protein
MQGKKYLTIACAAGILASGACLLPPPRQTLPPPPLLRIDLRGVQSIRVAVTNNSETRHIDADELARWIVVEINTHKDSGTPKARLKGTERPNEAILRVTLLGETANGTSINVHGYAEHMWTVNIDAVLTAGDGTVIWRQANRSYQSKGSFPVSASDDGWRNPSIRDRIGYDISQSLVKQMLFGAE